MLTKTKQRPYATYKAKLKKMFSFIRELATRTAQNQFLYNALITGAWAEHILLYIDVSTTWQ